MPSTTSRGRSAARSQGRRGGAARPARPPSRPTRVGYNTDSIRVGPTSDRFVGRRQEIRRQQGARRLRVVLALTVVSLLAVSAIGVLNSELADVDAVTVVGNDRTTTDEVVAATSIVAGQPLLDLDLAAAETGVEALPWIRKADVERRLDGEIIVRIVEREPVLALPVDGSRNAAAATGGAAGYVLIDRLGHQLELVDRRPEEFLPVVGIEATGRPGTSAPSETGLVLSLVESLPPALAEQVTAMTLQDGDVHLELVSGAVANVGDSSLLGEKIQALETVLARVDLDCVSLIDVRVPSAAAIRRSESAEGQCL